MKKGILLLGLLLTLYLIGRGQTYLINEGFNNGTTAPSGWTFTSIGGTYTTSGNYGASSPSLKMDATADAVETTTFSNPNQLSFWIKGQTISGTNHALLVEEYYSSAWHTIENITPISNTATTKTYTLNSGTTKVKFTFTKGTGNLAFDDVKITQSIITPSTQAHNITFSGISTTGMIPSWTNGDGSKRVVIMNTSNSFTNPTDGTDPTANPAYSGSGEQVIYNNSSNTVTVSGLTASTTYWYRVYEYNGSGATTKYLTTEGTNNPNSQTTASEASPTITLTGSLNTFAPTVIGSTSSEQNYSVAGSNLTANISIVPPAGFEISTGTGGSFVATNPIVLSPSGGTVETTTIYVRFAPSSAQEYTGNISHTSTDASTKNQAVSGAGIKAEPTNHVTSFSVVVGSPSYNSITATWTDASGGTLPDKYLIKGSSTSYDAIVAPIDGTPETDATLVKNITQGTQTASFTGLNSNTTYYFKIYPYTNSSANINYKADGSVPQSSTTTEISPWIEDFETGTKSSYTAADILCTKGYWNITEALIGTTVSDRKYNLQSIRMRYTSASIFGTLTMNFDKSNGAGTVTVYHALYGSDITGSWKLQMSVDGGLLWSDIGSTVTTSSSTLTSQDFAINQAGNVRFKIVQLSGNRINIDNFTISDYTGSTTWSGATSSNWALASNWGNGIPTSSNDVIIPNVVNDPIIVSSSTTKSLTINSDAVLTINGGGALTVTGTLTNSAGNSGLVIESGGSLINNTASVGATVKREIASDAQYHFLSSPVSGQNICDGNFAPDASHFNSGDQENYGKKFDFFKWSETAGSLNWINLKNTDWTLNTSDFGGATPQFESKTGYLVNYNGFTGSSTTKTFAGTLYNGDQTITLTHSGNTWNLVGNPFPSAIDWSIIDKTNLSENYCYIFNPSKAGGAGYEAQDGGYIAPMQGFFVAATGNSLSIPNSARAHSNSWMKNASAIENQLNIKLGNSTNYDETVVKFIANGNINKDRSDAFKLYSLDTKIPQVYTLKNDEVKVCINSLPFFTEPFSVPLGMLIPADGNYSIELSGFESFPSVPGILLEDLKTQATQNMVQNPVYSFSATTNDNDHRFVLHFSGPIGINEKPAQQAFHIFASGNTLFIMDKTGKNQGNVFVYNMMGQLLSASKLNDNTRINLDVPAGYYLVKVIAPENTQSSKVFIQ